MGGEQSKQERNRIVEDGRATSSAMVSQTDAGFPRRRSRNKSKGRSSNARALPDAVDFQTAISGPE